jgi:hypothetical protein
MLVNHQLTLIITKFLLLLSSFSSFENTWNDLSNILLTDEHLRFFNWEKLWKKFCKNFNTSTFVRILLYLLDKNWEVELLAPIVIGI